MTVAVDSPFTACEQRRSPITVVFIPKQVWLIVLVLVKFVTVEIRPSSRLVTVKH